jgi:hypothetical protein
VFRRRFPTPGRLEATIRASSVFVRFIVAEVYARVPRTVKGISLLDVLPAGADFGGLFRPVPVAPDMEVS